MPVLRIASILVLALSFVASVRAADVDLPLDTFRRKAQVRLAEAAFAANDVDSAQQRLEEALALARKASHAPELSAILERLGDVYVRRDQLHGARAFYMRALQTAPGDDAKLRALDRLGSVAMRRGLYPEAADWFRQSISLHPSASAGLRLGEALLAAGRLEEARAAFEQTASVTEPAGLANLHDSIARRYLWLAHDSGNAKIHFDRALELRRHDSQRLVRALRGAALRAQDAAAAESSLAELAALPGETARAHQIRARRLAARDLEGAVAEQQAAVALLRSAPAPSLGLAEALEQLAKFEERRGEDIQAAALRREALEHRGDRSSPAALAAVAALSANLERAGDSAGAETLWIDHIAGLESQPRPDSLAIAAAAERFGDLLLRQDYFETAVQRYEQVASMRRRAWGVNDGGLQLTLEKLADALRLSGREDEARRVESQIALLSIVRPSTRVPPRGPRDTGTWLSDSAGLVFIGLALSGATFGLVWLGWMTVARLQPEIEASFRPAAPRLAGAPGWIPIPRPEVRYPLSFRGRGGSLFGIWSVNVALTLLTLGLYFFWGKVRVRRYFWGQAELAGDRFTFHGTGRELLFGWFKAAPVLALLLWGPSLLNLASDDPNAGLYGAGVALGLIGVLWPLAEIGANRYRLSRTSWRAIRFSFHGAAWPYMKLWLGGMALWVLTLGLWTPFFDAARRRFLLQHTRFGDARFECDAHGRDLFPFFLVSWALLLPTLGVSHFWYKALAERYFWSRTKLLHNENTAIATFECSLKGFDLLVLWMQTMAALALTLGLGWPWTRVWEARLRLQTISLTGDFRPGRIRQSPAAAGAAGEGAADFLGLDFGFIG